MLPKKSLQNFREMPLNLPIQAFKTDKKCLLIKLSRKDFKSIEEKPLKLPEKSRKSYQEKPSKLLRETFKHSYQRKALSYKREVFKATKKRLKSYVKAFEATKESPSYLL